MSTWLGQMASGAALGLGAHLLFTGLRAKPLRGWAALGSALIAIALACLWEGDRPWLAPLWGILFCGAVTSAVYLSHRFLALHLADREAMRALSRAYADLQASARWRELGVSAASISHEIRNYAAALKGNALLLDRGLQDPASRPDELDRIRFSAERMEAITRGISAFADAPERLRLEPLDLEKVIRRSLEGRFPGKRVEIRGAGDARLRGDAGRLEQVFLNFFRNAWEAGAARVQVRMLAWRGKLIVAVEDDGSGCPREDLERIALPFFSRKAEGGTGLGCSIADSILRAHGASLRAYSKNVLGGENRGLILNMVFPSDGPVGAAPGELPVAAGPGPARENLIRPMLHLGLRPRLLDPCAAAPDWMQGSKGMLFLDSAAEGRLAGRPPLPAVVVGPEREAVRRPGGETFLFSEEALIRVLEKGALP